MLTFRFERTDSQWPEWLACVDGVRRFEIVCPPTNDYEPILMRRKTNDGYDEDLAICERLKEAVIPHYPECTAENMDDIVVIID